MSNVDRSDEAPESPARVCVSCGAAGVDRFCPRCGQRHRDRTPTAREFFRDIRGTLMDLDGPTRCTMRDFMRPGRLTIGWLERKYSKHISPIRLYIIASAVYFLISHSVEGASVLFVRFGNKDEAAALRGATELTIVGLLPYFGGIVALARRRLGLGYVAHLVFAMHVQVAWMVLLTLAVFFEWFSLLLTGKSFTAAFDAASVLCVAYLATALRTVYELGWPRAVLEAVLMVFAYSVGFAALIFAIRLVAL